MSNFSFCHSVFKRLVPQTHKSKVKAERSCRPWIEHESNMEFWKHGEQFGKMKERLVTRIFFFFFIVLKTFFLAPLAVGQRAYVMVRCPSCVRPSVRRSVRALTFSLNIFFAETTYRILMKFHRNVPTMVLFRISWNNLIPSKTLVAMATKLKIFWNLWKSSCQKPYGLELPNLACSFT